MMNQEIAWSGLGDIDPCKTSLLVTVIGYRTVENGIFRAQLRHALVFLMSYLAMF
jgi:hypothetical protein